jgi:hypothetical protein
MTVHKPVSSISREEVTGISCEISLKKSRMISVNGPGNSGPRFFDAEGPRDVVSGHLLTLKIQNFEVD